MPDDDAIKAEWDRVISGSPTPVFGVGSRMWFQGKEAPRGWREIEYTSEGSIEHVLAEKEPE
jgi:hypothetical protein